MNNAAKLIMVTAAFLLIGTASLAFAEDTAKSVTTMEKMRSCPQQKEMGRFHRNMGRSPDNKALSEEQIVKLDAQRAEFHDATRDLHQELTSKEFALKSELAKKEPDAKTAKTLQKDISALHTELGQKRIEHLLEMKKIAPYGEMGQMRGDWKKSEKGRFRRM